MSTSIHPNDLEYAPFSMVGTCEDHGFQAVTRVHVVYGADSTPVYFLRCGCVETSRRRTSDK